MRLHVQRKSKLKARRGQRARLMPATGEETNASWREIAPASLWLSYVVQFPAYPPFSTKNLTCYLLFFSVLFRDHWKTLNILPGTEDVARESSVQIFNSYRIIDA